MTDSAKLRASVFVCLTCSLAYESTCFACQNIHFHMFGMLTCLFVWHPRILTCSCAYTLRCSRAVGLKFLSNYFFHFFLLITKKV